MVSEKQEKREMRLTLQVTQSELYMISRKAKMLEMSRPNLVVDAVLKYEKESAQETVPDHNKVVEMLPHLPYPVFVKDKQTTKWVMTNVSAP